MSNSCYGIQKFYCIRTPLFLLKTIIFLDVKNPFALCIHVVSWNLGSLDDLPCSSSRNSFLITVLHLTFSLWPFISVIVDFLKKSGFDFIYTVLALAIVWSFDILLNSKTWFALSLSPSNFLVSSWLYEEAKFLIHFWDGYSDFASLSSRFKSLGVFFIITDKDWPKFLFLLWNLLEGNYWRLIFIILLAIFHYFYFLLPDFFLFIFHINDGRILDLSPLPTTFLKKMNMLQKDDLVSVWIEEAIWSLYLILNNQKITNACLSCSIFLLVIDYVDKELTQFVQKCMVHYICYSLPQKLWQCVTIIIWWLQAVLRQGGRISYLRSQFLDYRESELGIVQHCLCFPMHAHNF